MPVAPVDYSLKLVCVSCISVLAQTVQYRDRDPPQANGLYHSMLLSFMSSFHIQRFVEELKTALCNL